MRCNNCGWDNTDPNSKTCLKCGHTLPEQGVSGYNNYRGNEAYISEEAKKTRVINGMSDSTTPLKATVIQGRQREGANNVIENSGLCPRCKYPMNGNYCANCGYERDESATQSDKEDASWNDSQKAFHNFIKESQNECTKCGAKVPREYRYCPMCAEPIVQATINPFKNRKAQAKPDDLQPKCTLEIIAETDNQTDNESVKHEYQGKEIKLNRENTDPYNRTITAKEQAELMCKDGKWTIIDRSEFKSTFVFASHEIELQSGDIILLGDRRFRFKAE